MTKIEWKKAYDRHSILGQESSDDDLCEEEIQIANVERRKSGFVSEMSESNKHKIARQHSKVVAKKSKQFSKSFLNPNK